VATEQHRHGGLHFTGAGSGTHNQEETHADGAAGRDKFLEFKRTTTKKDGTPLDAEHHQPSR